MLTYTRTRYPFGHVAAILRLTSHESPPVERLSLHIPAPLSS